MPNTLAVEGLTFSPSSSHARPAVVIASGIAASLSLVALLALFAWSLLAPGPYPNATRSHVRLPNARVDLRGGCLQWTLIDKAYYAAPQDQAAVIGWLKQAGWMGNFRYDDSVLKQTGRHYGPVYVVWVCEIFVENRGAGANLVSTTQATVSVGGC